VADVNGAPVWFAIALAMLLAILAMNAAGMRLRWAAVTALLVLVMGLALSSLIITWESQGLHQRSTTDDLAQH